MDGARVSYLQHLAPELILRIASDTVCGGTSNHALGPPQSILSLSLTCRRINRVISLPHNLILKAEIFRLKFDTSAVLRRLGPEVLTISTISCELTHRFEALKRIRRCQIDDVHLLSDLWAACLMMMENDGLNEVQLLDWAQLGCFLKVLLSVGATTWKSGCDCWLPSLAESPVVVCLLWLVGSSGWLESEMPENRKAIISLLHPFVVAGYRYPNFYASDAHYHLPPPPKGGSPLANTRHSDSSTFAAQQTPLSSPCEIVHFGKSIRVTTPPITATAFLAMAARLELLNFGRVPSQLPVNRSEANAMGRRGPTIQDMDEHRSTSRVRLPIRQRFTYSKRNDGCSYSQQYDPDWYRIVACNDHDVNALGISAFKSKSFVLGKLSGLWSGKLMVPDWQMHMNLLGDSSRTSPCQVQLYQRPLYFRLREHVCYRQTGISYPSGDGEGDGKHAYNAWLAEGSKWKENLDEGYLDVFDSKTRKAIRYKTHTPRGDSARQRAVGRSCLEDTEAMPANDCQEEGGDHGDILLTGSTDARHAEAWEHFTFIGRVRRWDGLVNPSRVPFRATYHHPDRFTYPPL